MSTFICTGVLFLALLVSSLAFSRVRSRGSMQMVSKYITSKKPIFVAGGTSGVGLEVVKLLVDQGNPVQCLVRRPESVGMLEEISKDLITCTIGDALDEAAVQECMNNCVAAVTTLGGKPSENGKRVDYIGNSNVVEQAGILGCERIILVTSIGCGPTKDAVGEDVYEVLKEALVAKDKAERDLRMYTNLDWTIIRPGGLKSEAATGKAILTDDVTAVGTIHRADVASLVVKALGSEGKATRKELSAVDPSVSENLAVNAFDV